MPRHPLLKGRSLVFPACPRWKVATVCDFCNFFDGEVRLSLAIAFEISLSAFSLAYDSSLVVSDNVAASLAGEGECWPMGLGIRRLIERFFYSLSLPFILTTCLVETFL
jgi:hypothetical protein